MSNREKTEKGTAVSVPSRAVAIQIGDQTYMPALPRSAAAAEALRGNLHVHLGAIAMMDKIYASAEALAAGRSIIYDPGAQIEAFEESRVESAHVREVAKTRRKKEIHEAKLAALEAQHRYEAVRDFKEEKFAVGRARFKQRVAEAAVGEAVAREGLGEELLEPQQKSRVLKGSNLAEQFARMVDDLEKEIEEAEAAGRPTDTMRAEQNTLNRLLRRELLKIQT